eukprot:jgi/Pico_ML_1/54784/g648.t2
MAVSQSLRVVCTLNFGKKPGSKKGTEKGGTKRGTTRGLAKPSEYLLFDVDSLDQNKAVNKAGSLLGKVKPEQTTVSDGIVPYNNLNDINRFRECELIHGRWAMLAVLGAIVSELVTGVNWVEAGKVELDGASYAGLALPFSITQLVVIQVLAMGFVEIQRNGEKNVDKRCYPGGYFDPLNLADPSKPEQEFAMKEREIKHCRLAMIAFLGFGIQGLTTGTGPVENLAQIARSFG